MSKIDKNIETATEWLKKHAAEALDLGALTGALATWDAKVQLVEAGKAQLAASKKAALLARKEVTVALANAKAARKATSKAKSTSKSTASQP